MELDSARELKSLLSEKLLAMLATPVRTRSLIGPARTFSDSEPQPPTIALGVTPRKHGDFALAVRVQRRGLTDGRGLDLIQRQAKGEVEVRYIGRVLKCAPSWHQQRNRPLRIGGSVGHYKVTAGTLGCFVRPRGGKEILILSNNHVLANENRARKGEVILQPGRLDGGATPADAVAVLSDFVRLKRHGLNFVDCAAAALKDGLDPDALKLTGLGRLSGLGDPFVDEGMKVSKVGRTTGLTHGRVTAFELDNLVIEFDSGHIRFDNQIEIESDGSDSFSQGGDSGSVIVDENLRAIGLLFAGSDQGGRNGQGLTYANPIHTALDELRVELAV